MILRVVVMKQGKKSSAQLLGCCFLTPDETADWWATSKSFLLPSGPSCHPRSVEFPLAARRTSLARGNMPRTSTPHTHTGRPFTRTVKEKIPAFDVSISCGACLCGLEFWWPSSLYACLPVVCGFVHVSRSLGDESCYGLHHVCTLISS